MVWKKNISMQNTRVCRLPFTFPASAKSFAAEHAYQGSCNGRKVRFYITSGNYSVVSPPSQCASPFFKSVRNIDYTFMLSFATAKMLTAILSQNAVFLNYCSAKPQSSPRGAFLRILSSLDCLHFSPRLVR